LYKDCFASGYAIFRDSNMVDLKFTFSISPEIRDQADLSCAGLGLIVLPHKETAGEIAKSFGSAVGVGPHPGVRPSSSEQGMLTCKEDYQLMVRPPLYNTACVKISDVSKFIDRGWTVAPSDTSQLSSSIMPIIPTSKERAMSYKVQFQGTDIKTQTFYTFSNFAPVADISLNPQPSYILSGQQPMFALWSLPSKDKQPFYNLVSMYINPGIKPNPFDVKVDIMTGDNNTLQTWSFQKCSVISYIPFLNQNIVQYKFHMKWPAEIQDISTFVCSGLNLKS